MSSTLLRNIPQHQAVVNPLPPENHLWDQAARSIPQTALVAAPGAGATIVQIQTMRTWQASDIFRLDWSAWYDTTAGPANDMQIFMANQPWFTLPVVGATNVVTSGTLFLVPAGDIIVKAIAGSSGHYACSLVLTRLLNGFRAG
jgi:hypothetical protein